MNLLMSALAVLGMALSGAGALQILWRPLRDAPRSVRLALGFCVGTFVVTWLFFIAYVLGISFSRPWLIVPTGCLAALGLAGVVRGAWRRPQPDFTGFLAILLVLLALTLSWSRPIHGYDALSMWALKAKITFYANTWPSTLFDPYTTHHPEYPPLVPCAQASIFYWMNTFDDVASRAVFAAFFASGAVILWWFLGCWRVSSRGIWLLWWCALPGMMEQVKITYADLPLAVFLLGFFGALASWLRDPRQTNWLRLASIFAGVTFWVKHDAIIGVGAGFLALLLVAAVRKLPVWPVVAAALGAIILAMPWWWLVTIKNLPKDYAFWPPDLLARTALIVRELTRYALLDGNHAFFWTVFAVTLCFRWKRLRNTENLWFLTTTAVGLLVTIVVYLCSTVDLEAQLKTSADRVLLNLFVPALLLTALLWRSSFKIVRLEKWQAWAATAVFVLVVARLGQGWLVESDQAKFGVYISPFPPALSAVWLVAIALTIWKFFSKYRQPSFILVWRTVQFAIVVATLGLSLVSIAVYARETGESWRRFSGKTLEEKHALTLDPATKHKMEEALARYPTGTHVSVLPKRDLRYHQFYYESFPRLVADSLATNLVMLESSINEK